LANAPAALKSKAARLEKKDKDIERRGRDRFRAGVDRLTNNQKHFRDPNLPWAIYFSLPREDILYIRTLSEDSVYLLFLSFIQLLRFPLFLFCKMNAIIPLPLPVSTYTIGWKIIVQIPLHFTGFRLFHYGFSRSSGAYILSYCLPSFLHLFVSLFTFIYLSLSALSLMRQDDD